MRNFESIAQQIMKIISLLPAYLVVLAIVLVIIPTIIGIVARFFLYLHLNNSAKKVRQVLEGKPLERRPAILRKIEQRFQDFKISAEEINTNAIIAGSYSQEKCRVFGIPFDCGAIAYFTRLLPNLLLSFGLLGTFLGITINLTNLSQTITQVDITDIRNLVEELNQPLQGMGVAFITSLVAIACSSLLTVINLFWNTNLAKSKLLNYLEDFADNLCLPQLQVVSPLESAIVKFSESSDQMLTNLGTSIEDAITNAFKKIDTSAEIFERAASTLDQSRFPEQLANATNDLAIAQNNFSQSSLVLKKTTQSFEHSLDGMQKAMRQVADLKDEVKSSNQKYDSLLGANQSNQKTELSS